MNLKTNSLFLLALMLSACITVSSPTPTSTPPTRFTSRILLGTPDGGIVEVYTQSTLQDFSQAAVAGKPKMNFIGDSCATLPETKSVICYGGSPNSLFASLILITIESGCWTATKTNLDFSIPKPCP